MSTENLAEFVSALDYDSLPCEVVEKTKLLTLDTVACMVGGASADSAARVIRTVNRLGGQGSSPVVCSGFRASAPNASLANGAAAHALELDEVYRPAAVHAAAVVVPVSLALGEELGSTGKQVISAIVAGYEVAARVGLALGKSHYQLWHTTATAGTLGAAAAAAKMLRLNVPQTLDALGNAGTMAAGLWQFSRDGAMSKVLHVGHAAFSGLLAALLSQEGFTGAHRILEGSKGLLAAMSRDPAPEGLVFGLGENLQLLDTSVKLYPTCGHTHSTIDAALDLQAEHDYEAGSIRSVVVETYNVAADIAGVETPLSTARAKFSLKYCVAVSFLYGRCTLHEFGEACLRNPAVLGLMDKVTVVVNPEWDDLYPGRWRSKVTVDDGRASHSATVDFPRGSPQRPASLAQIERKGFDACRLVWNQAEYGALVALVQRLETLEDTRPIGELLVNPNPSKQSP